MSVTPVYCATKHGVIGFSRSMAKVSYLDKTIETLKFEEVVSLR